MRAGRATQIWIAISTYVLVAIVRQRLKFTATLYEILQILSLAMFEQMPLAQLLTKKRQDENPLMASNQLNLFD